MREEGHCFALKLFKYQLKKRDSFTQDEAKQTPDKMFKTLPAL